MPTDLRIKRIYDPVNDDDGYRILVDRLWPRGLTKVEAHIDLWAKEFAPSTELRKWLHEDATRYETFARKYRRELEEHRADIEHRLRKIDAPTITLLTATKQPESGHAPILKQFLRGIV